MRWPVSSLVGLLVLLCSAEAVATPPSHPPGTIGVRPWSALAPARSPASNRAGAPCDEVPGAQCGRVFVPLDRDRPKGAQIGIFFAVFPHTDAGAPAEGTIFATFGGPGASATQIGGEGFASGIFGPLRERRDVVLID